MDFSQAIQQKWRKDQGSGSMMFFTHQERSFCMQLIVCVIHE